MHLSLSMCIRNLLLTSDNSKIFTHVLSRCSPRTNCSSPLFPGHLLSSYHLYRFCEMTPRDHVHLTVLPTLQLMGLPSITLETAEGGGKSVARSYGSRLLGWKEPANKTSVIAHMAAIVCRRETYNHASMINTLISSITTAKDDLAERMNACYGS